MLLADPRWWEASRASVEPELTRLCRGQGVALDVVVSPEGALPPALRRRPPRLLLVSPPAAASASALAATLPDTLVLVAGRPREPRPTNLLWLHYSAEEAFAEAGRRAAAAGPECLVGLLTLPEGQGASLRASFVADNVAVRLRERLISPRADRLELRAAIDDLYAQGVRLFVVALRGLTPQCLELLEGRDSLAVVEGQEASGAFGALVLATIEPDWAAAVAAALAPSAQARGSGVLPLPGRLSVRIGAPGATWPCRPPRS